jgi:hypothetical protein
VGNFFTKIKTRDILFTFFCLLFFLSFILIEPLLEFYKTFNQQHGMIMSFIKFSVLATLGEVIGLRIKTGYYNKTGFGIFPRAIVWGFLGLTIQMAFVIFSTGATNFLEYMGMQNANYILMMNSLSFEKLWVAFFISLTMNLIYAPIMMTIHKITDIHIENNGGTISGLFRPIKMGEIISQINWKVQWGFVFKKTIPYFWIPAHTLTFLLPPSYRVLFAALLGIMLGILLAIAAVNSKK